MAMATENVYAQAPLVIEQREIRILSLAPGIGDSVLRGDLIVESLDYDDLHYTALSYTWSGPVSQCSIIIGRVPLHITENLELALRHIRGLDRPKNLWVDAICINQNNNEEKSVQVLLMGDIYANAARTIVWLGEQSADSDMAMDFIHSLRRRGSHQLDIYPDEDSSDEGSSDEEDNNEDEYDGETSNTDSDDNGRNKDDGCADDSDKDDSDKDDVNKDDVNKDDVNKDDGDGLADSDPGIPEVSSDENSGEEDVGDGDSSDESSSDESSSGESSSDEDDGNGDSSDQNSSDEDKSVADQITLQAVTNLMQRQWWTRIWVVQEALKSRRVTVVCGAKEVDIAYFAHLFKANKEKKLRKGFQMPFVEILSDWYLRKNQTETGGFSLMDLTLLTHRFQASVQKDKIYALLGLATPDARSWIVPDYSDAMSYRIILVRLTAYFLQFSSRPLRFASHCRATNGPSWVSDWTAIDSRTNKLIDREDAQFEDELENKSFSRRSARSLERLPESDHKTARFNPRFDPPFQELTKYQMPATLLVYGILVDRVRVVFQIPHVHRDTGDSSKTDISSLKAKVREWETWMIEYLETYQSEIGIVQKKPQWRKGATSKHKRKKAWRRRDLKASLIKYLWRRGSRDPEDFKCLNFLGQIRDLGDEATVKIRDYEAWIQQPRQDNCGSCKDHLHEQSDSCASCSTCTKLRRANDLGRKIVELNAGKTMFLTDDDHHYVVPFATLEGDIICRLWHSFYYLVLRRTGDEHWTLVGHIQSDCALLEEANKVDRDHAIATTKMFKLV